MSWISFAGICATFLCLLAWPGDAPVAGTPEPAGPIHFLIPGGAGGGWDRTARATGSALVAAGLVASVSFENMSGGSGGKAVTHLIETARQSPHVLMVNSMPIVARSLMPAYRQNWRDLTPIAAVIGDYGAVFVRADSPIGSLQALIACLRKRPRGLTVAGGSSRGGLDHLIIASTFSAAGLNPMDARYVPYDAGGKAVVALLSGEVDLMSATVGDAIALVRNGEFRILGVAAPERLRELPDVPTMREQGFAVEFVNWRGFFAAPGLNAHQRSAYIGLLERLMSTPAWAEALARNGWVANFVPGERFERFLTAQEHDTRVLMRELGFLP